MAQTTKQKSNSSTTKKTSTGNTKRTGTSANKNNNSSQRNSTKTKRKTSSSKTGSGSGSHSVTDHSFPYTREIALLIMFAFCVVMFLGNIGVGGVVGNFLSMFSKGLFGVYIGMIIPILLFFVVVYVAYNWVDVSCWVRVSGIILVLISITSICETAINDRLSIAQQQVWENCFQTPGGVTGILMAKMLIPGFGKAGAIALLIVLLLIGIILVTGKSLLRLVRSISDNAYEKALDEKEYNRQLAQERMIRRRERKLEQQAREAESQERELEWQEEHKEQLLQQENATKSKVENVRLKGSRDTIIMPPPPKGRSRRVAPSNKNTLDQSVSSLDQNDSSAIELSMPQKSNTNMVSQDSLNNITPGNNIPGDDLKLFDLSQHKTPVNEGAFNKSEEFERPAAPTKRPVYGITKDTKLKPDKPNDNSAVEMNINNGIVVKSKQTTNAKRMTYEGNIAYGMDVFTDDMMTKTDPDVIPPEPIKPQLKPKKDIRTLSELSNLDENGDTVSGYESASDLYAKKHDIPIGRNVIDPMNEVEFDDDTVSADTAAATITSSGSDITSDHMKARQQIAHADWDNGNAEARQEPNIIISDTDSREPETTQKQPLISKTQPTDDEELGYRTVTTASGKVIRARLNAVAGEKQLEPEDRMHTVEEDDDKLKLNVYDEKKPYIYPSTDLLIRGNNTRSKALLDKELRETASKLQQTLQNFGVGVTVTNISCGPTVTRYELQPEQGVKVSKIVALTDDIKLNLAAADIRIEAPIPGKAAIGIEVPNKENVTVMLRDLLESNEFINSKSKLAFAAGKDIAGQTIVTDIAKMPHLLIAGSTGSGKSVCINTLIISILYKASPKEVKLIMIDPKVVELSIYNGIPHLLIPVVTEPKKAAGALNWAVAEMDDRYQKFAECNVRDLKGYNEKIDETFDDNDPNKPGHMSQIVIIIDELADLMMVAPSEVEDSIIRLAQKARAAGIHLVIATQRPSVNVITGLIKANVPSRIAFSVYSGVDSRTILDMNGAEKLLGKGDMLFYPSGYSKPIRVQGAFVSDKEVNDIVEFLKNQEGVEGGGHQNINLEAASAGAGGSNGSNNAMAGTDNGLDELFIQAGRFIIEKDKASIGMLQRMFRIGFNRAARIMDQLYDAGVVGEEEGTKPRKILMSEAEFESYVDEYV